MTNSVLRSWVTALTVLFTVTSVSGCILYNPYPQGRLEYTVRPGETLSEIGERFMVPPAAIQRANNISDPRSLQAGRRIVIPFAASLDKVDNGSDRGRASMKFDEPSARRLELAGAARYVGNLDWPVRSTKLNSRFGWRRGRFHEGIDISSESGAKVFAAHAGRVVYEGSGLRGYGRIVVVRGADIMTVYAHNRRNRVDVGEEVERGEWIADTGSSGHTSGPHLHFEVRIRDDQGKNVAVDPLAFFPGH